MRKFFALALAVAMVLSLASVSFAADTFADDTISQIALSRFFKYDGDTNEVKDAQAEYGKSYYAMLFEGKWTITDNGEDGEITNASDKQVLEFAPIKDYKAVEKLKVKAEFEMGEDLVESVSIVKKDIDVLTITNPLCAKAKDADDSGTINEAEYDAAYGTGAWDDAGHTTPLAVKVNIATQMDEINESYVGAGADAWDTVTKSVPDDVDGGYYYFVEIKTKKERVTGDADIIGTLEFKRKAKDEINEIEEVELDFDLNLFYENAYINKSGEATMYTVTGDEDVTLKWDKVYVLKFDCDEDATFTFGSDELNEGEFTVDVSGQGKMVVDFSTKANEAIVDANPGAKMFFVNFNGAKFNRTGTFEYEMENMVAAYEIVDDKLVEIKGLEIDGDTAIFSTRALGNYVFADAELVNAVAEAPVVEAPAVTNPTTGAAA